MSRSADPADFPTFVPDNDLKREGAAFPHRLLAQHLRKEEDGLPPGLGVRGRRSLKGHLGVQAAQDEIIGRHEDFYVRGSRAGPKWPIPDTNVLERPQTPQASNVDIVVAFRRVDG